MVLGEPATEGLAAELWRQCKQEALRALSHPFVQGLGQGSLARTAFKDYVAQDAFYLTHFAQAYALAAQKAADTHVEEQRTLLELHDGVIEEARLHASYAQQLGITEDELKRPNNATLRYTDFLLRVAKEQDIDCILAALTPCCRLYAFLGCQLAAKYPEHNHSFSDWIKTYSDPGFLEITDKNEQLLNQFSSKSPPETLLGLYRTAMQMELDFFDAHLPL